MAMIDLPPDFKEFLRLLSDRRVEYLLIGGYAVAYHGYPRATADIDIWIEIATSISGVDFQDCWSARIVDVLDGVEVNIIDLKHLKINKQAAGRHKDLDDLENLP